MTDPGFKIEGIHQAVPFRPRVAFDGYHLFINGDTAVLVGPSAARGMRTAACKARPLETGGLLSGRALRDADGHYVIVSGFAEADSGSGRAAAFEISPQATARLREESSRADPTADVVGWWHSHLRPSHYSQTDLTTQSMWSQPDSVGLLVFADGEPWAKAYIGPSAKELSYHTAAPPSGHAGTLGPVSWDGDGRVVAGARHDLPELTIPSPFQRRAWQLTRQQRGLSRLAVIIASVLLLLLILSVFLLTAQYGLSSRLNSEQRMLSDRIDLAQRQFSSEIERAQATPRTYPSISWSCIPASPPLGSYRCHAITSGVRGTVRWQLDGKLYTSGLSVIIHVPQDRRAHIIQALLETPAGIFSGTTQTITPG
jgi:proteasome lid subunit RPN8/RPN11